MNRFSGINANPTTESRAKASLSLRLLVAAFSCLLCFTSAGAVAQPRVSAQVFPESVHVGQSFALEVQIRWRGDANRFVLYPLALNLPSGVSMGPLKQRYETQGSDTVYFYSYGLTAEKSGKTPLGTISLSYREVNSSSTDSEEPPPPIEEEAPVIEVLPGGMGGLLSQLLLPGLILGVLALLLFFRRRRSGTREEAPRSPPESSPTDLLEMLRKQLSEGEYHLVYEGLIALKPMLPSEEDPLPSLEKLEAERLRLRYGGMQSSREELERLIRPVERIFRRFPEGQSDEADPATPQ